MVSKVIQEYGNNGFCLQISHKKVGLKKRGLTCRKIGFVFPFQRKKFYVTKKQELQKQKSVKTGFI